MDATRVSVVGATGYTGAELLRLIAGHPRLELAAIVGHSTIGQPVAEALPSVTGTLSARIEAFDASAVASRSDAVFCALPHGASAAVVRELRALGTVVLDLSADFRLADPEVHREWYGDHAAPELVSQAVYGLVELHREALRTADLIAVPGCFPTASILALAPLVREGLVAIDSIVIDAKTGVSGAGRAPKLEAHLPEIGEGIRAYKVAGLHRHTPEIEQELGRLAGQSVRVTFTPHLIPITRGVLATAYAVATPSSLGAERCAEAARALYDGSPAVSVLPVGTDPDTLWVRGANRALLSYAVDARTGRVVAQCAIDNLVKGAAGQAVQCLNVRFGFDEAEGLRAPAVWP